MRSFQKAKLVGTHKEIGGTEHFFGSREVSCAFVLALRGVPRVFGELASRPEPSPGSTEEFRELHLCSEQVHSHHRNK